MFLISALAGGRFEDARRAFRRLVELGAANAAAYNNLAILLRRDAEPEAALRVARSGVDRDPAFPQTYFTLGGLLEQRGDTSGAIAAYRAFLARWEGDASAAEQVRNRLKRLVGTGG